MGFIILLLLFCSIIAFISYIVCGDGSAAIVGFCICLAISMFIMAVTWGESYGNSVAMQERLVSIDQYAQTVKTYSKYAVAEFSARGSEITDLKYQNYQDQIGELITDLRDEINKYNTRLVGKNLMNKNWFWNWCIIEAPEGSVILRCLTTLARS